MADTADTQPIPAKADAAAEKAYANAAGQTAKAPAPATARIDAVVAEVKPATKMAAAPGNAKPARSATKAVRIKPQPKKTRAPRRATKALPATPKTVAAPKRAAATTATLKDKIMATNTADFAEGLKTAAADAQTRAKAAYDKFQGYAGEMTDMTKGNVEAIVESAKILGAGVQDIARGELEAARGAFETATADLKAMAAVKSPTELFKLQGEIARRTFDAAVARASKNAEVSLKLANDAFAPISSRMSLAAERLSNAA